MENYCIKCKQPITSAEYHFSYSKFDKALCRNHQPTSEARRLGKKLEELDWDVRYEFYDGKKSVDISIPEAKVDIEVDGSQHTTRQSQALSDLERTYYSYKNGFITLHIPNILAADDNIVCETAKWINKFLKDNYEDVKDSDVEENVVVKFFQRLFSK